MSTDAQLPERVPGTGPSDGANEHPDGATEPESTGPAVNDVRARYAISVVANLVGTGQQNIRLYETRGLLTPHRTPGGTRQYSDRDVAVLLRISELLEEGLNLAGVAKVLELEAVNAKLRADLKRARARIRKQSSGPRLPG